MASKTSYDNFNLIRSGSEDFQAMELIEDIDVEDCGTIGDSKDTDYLLAQGCEDKGADMILSCTEDTGKSTINDGKFFCLRSFQIILFGQVCNHSHFITF